MYFNGTRFHFRDSAILKFMKLQKNVLLKQSKCMRFLYLQFWSSLLGPFSFASRGRFFIVTRKHPFEMQKVRKDLFLSLNISEIRKLFFRKT